MRPDSASQREWLEASGTGTGNDRFCPFRTDWTLNPSSGGLRFGLSKPHREPVMYPFRLAVLPASLVLLAACSQPAAQGDWVLDGSASRLNFVSIKAGDVAETHRFTDLSGSVAPGGEAELVIDLASVDTGIGIRDERMREHFFEVADFPQARITARIDLSTLAELAPGERTTLAVDATLDLHGASVPLAADVVVTDLNGTRVLVESAAPVALHVGDFGLGDGLAALQDLAGLPSITPVTPVTFSLVFERG